ncbi:hypothetical protein ABT160_33395 [Streptomyces sp. NPDC001941]|uniref:hypothetical protein n=1 Tax=Streptomyces sp. NPDC001941 TaxID=3154659 RepID=UPI00331BE1A9
MARKFHHRKARLAAVAAVLLGAVAGTGFTACPSSATSPVHGENLFTGDGTITVGGRTVHVSCSGDTAPRQPVVVLMAGLGDGLDQFKGI